jgi:hypothetical protein
MLVEIQKQCVTCDRTLPLSEFFANARGRYGRHSLCKPCMNTHSKAKIASYRARGASRVPASKLCGMCQQTWPASGFGHSASTSDGLRTYCKQCDRVVRRSNKYGLSRDRVLEMLKQSNCEACGAHLPTTSDRHVDHRHSDGAVRGVLCEPCNTTLGKCRENPAILMGMCDYLWRTKDVDYRFQPYVEQILCSQDISPSGAPTPEEPGQICQTKPSQKLNSPQA